MIQRIYNFLKSIRMLCEQTVNKIMFAYFGVKMEGHPGKIEGIVTVRSQSKGTITIGSGIQLRAGKKYNMIGGDTRLILRTYKGGSIRIGKNVGISNSALVRMNHIEIEDNVMIGGNCKIWDTDFHSLNADERMDEYDTHINSAPIHIKKGAFIGANTILLKGVTIGEKSIIGAGSVVTKDIPDGQLWAGNPVRYIKKLYVRENG